MSKIEGPQVFAAIISLAIIGLVTLIFTPAIADKIMSGIISGILALGLKLLEKNGT
mgnify:CR=1 FL=1